MKKNTDLFSSSPRNKTRLLRCHRLYWRRIWWRCICAHRALSPPPPSSPWHRRQCRDTHQPNAVPVMSRCVLNWLTRTRSYDRGWGGESLSSKMACVPVRDKVHLKNCGWVEVESIAKSHSFRREEKYVVTHSNRYLRLLMRENWEGGVIQVNRCCGVYGSKMQKVIPLKSSLIYLSIYIFIYLSIHLSI